MTGVLTTAASLAAPPGWPEEAPDCVYNGLPGAIVQMPAPYTEADPLAILGQLLVGAGSVVGRGAWFAVEATRHHANELAVLVGDSSKARKGSSFDHVARLLARTDPDLPRRTRSGLSTGEGLVWVVRDPQGSDPGAEDPLLLVVEPELVSVLKATGRDMPTLSPVLRLAWAGRPLQLLTRTTPTRASGAHLCVIGHITASELRSHLHATEVTNGCLNRFVLLACRRVRLLPEGGDPDPLAGTGLREQLQSTLAWARTAGALRFSVGVRVEWWEAYASLSQAADGPHGAMCARAEVHVVRLALVYALLDRSPAIETHHLEAALALRDHAARSAAWALDPASGDPLAEQIHVALLAASDGLTRTELRDLFWRDQSAHAIDVALGSLVRSGRARSRRESTRGRPAERWRAVTPGNGP